MWKGVERIIQIGLIFLILSGCTGHSGENGNSVETQEEQPNARPVQMAQVGIASPTFSLNYIMGKFDPAADSVFVIVKNQHADRSGLYLRKDTYESFTKMYEAAQKDGVKLIIRSATRNFDYQKRIWEGKWTGSTKVDGKDLSKSITDPVTRALKILELSSMPGSSRHHWGTDIDLNSFNNVYFEKGPGKKIYDWLKAHAAEYGFCQPYSVKGEQRPFGYNEEKWHWSFMPVAGPLTLQASKQLKDEMISGFQGAETAGEVGIVKKYVLGINPECKQPETYPNE